MRLCPECGRAYHDAPRYNLRCWRRYFSKKPFCSPEKRNRDGVPIRKKCEFRPDGDLMRDAPLDDDIFESDRLENGHSDNGPDNSKPGAAFLRLDKVEAQFMQGLEAAWKPFGEREIVAVRETDPMVGMKCPWCRSFIRAGDHVVKCPCGKCETWFHMDVVRHLTCWNEWSGSKGHDFCPTTCARIEPEGPGEQEDGQ